MRKFTAYTIAFLLLLTACKKSKVTNATQDSLQGQWKLVEVKDKNTGTLFSKPAGASKDIIIKFKDDTFSGNTLQNDFSEGVYTLQNTTDIKFGAFYMTKVGEDQWGSKFIEVLQSCYLQSVSPCGGSPIFFQGNKLIIASPLRYDLTLERN